MFDRMLTARFSIASQNGLGGECARVVALHSPKLIIIAGRSKDKLVN